MCCSFSESPGKASKNRTRNLIQGIASIVQIVFNWFNASCSFWICWIFEQNKKQNRFQVVDSLLAEDSTDFDSLQQTMSQKFKDIKERDKPASQQPSFEKPSDLGRYQLLKNAVEEGNFDIAGPLGQRFNREHKSGEPKATYTKNKTHESKLKFRMLWANTQLEDLQKKMTKTTSWSEIHSNIGTYVPLAILIEHQGFAVDPVGARRRGLTYAFKCMHMGGAWTKVSSMTNELEYLEVREETREVHAKKWAEFLENDQTGKDKKQTASASSSGKASSSSLASSIEKNKGKANTVDKGKQEDEEGQPASGDKPVASLKRKLSGVAGEAAKPGDTLVATQAGGTPEAKKKRTKLAEEMSKASKVKSKLQNALVSADMITDAIKSDKQGWGWADNTENKGKLQAHHEKVKQSMVGDLNTFWLLSSKALLKKFGEEKLIVVAQQFQELEGPCDLLGDIEARLMRQHAALKTD